MYKMKINWKVRANNPQFWIQMLLAITVPIGAYFGISGADITTWGTLGSIVVSAIKNPYVLFTIAISVYNALIDPTTSGISDSVQALKYTKPKKRVAGDETR